MFQGIAAQRMLALFFAGWALLNFPLLALWDTGAQLWGLPIFPLGLFLIWGLLIGALAWIVERGLEADETH